MRAERRPALVALWAIALSFLILAGCGDDDPEAGEQTRLAAALATVTGPEPVGTGFGWIDVARLRDDPGSLGRELAWAAPALGPGAREIAGAGRSLERIGVMPLESEAMLSIATSYTLALRLDGVDPSPAAAALRDAGAKRGSDAGGAKRGSDAGWTTFDLGPEWTAALGTPIEPVGSLAARDAVRPQTLVLARSELARSKMLSSADPAIEAPVVATAANCLGDVVAARLVLNNHTHLSGVGPDMLAFGVSTGESEHPRDVFCAVGEPAAEVDSAAGELEHAFDRDAKDPVTDEPMRSLVAGSELDVYDDAAFRVARVGLTPAAGAEPGLFFRAFDRGSLLTYMGLQPPPTGN